MGDLGVAGRAALGKIRGTPQPLSQASPWLAIGVYLHGGALSMLGEGRKGLRHALLSSVLGLQPHTASRESARARNVRRSSDTGLDQKLKAKSSPDARLSF